MLEEILALSNQLLACTVLWDVVPTRPDIRYGFFSRQNLPLMFEVFKLSTEVENTAVMIRLWERKQEDSAMFHSRMKGVLRGGQELQDQHELKPIARVRPGGAPPPPTSKRKNIKWRHVSDRDFL